MSAEFDLSTLAHATRFADLGPLDLEIAIEDRTDRANEWSPQLRYEDRSIFDNQKTVGRETL